MNRGEIVAGKFQLQDVVVDKAPGDYPLTFLSVEPYKRSYVKYEFSLEGGETIKTIAPVYSAILDPGEPGYEYTLRVVQERASNK